MPVCQCLTAKEKPCKNSAMVGSIYCVSHKNCKKTISEPKQKSEPQKVKIKEPRKVNIKEPRKVNIKDTKTKQVFDFDLRKEYDLLEIWYQLRDMTSDYLLYIDQNHKESIFISDKLEDILEKILTDIYENECATEGNFRFFTLRFGANGAYTSLSVDLCPKEKMETYSYLIHNIKRTDHNTVKEYFSNKLPQSTLPEDEKYFEFTQEIKKSYPHTIFIK